MNNSMGNQPPAVVKFGGTSVKSIGRIQHVAQILDHNPQIPERPGGGLCHGRHH
ncbi:MAG: hypothetical protein U0105_08695 [Candidatus Obscuribacterales bacterium]